MCPQAFAGCKAAVEGNLAGVTLRGGDVGYTWNRLRRRCNARGTESIVMIDRLRQALEHIEELSPELQDELAMQIEEMIEPVDQRATPRPAPIDEHLPRHIAMALSAIGSWRKLQDDDEFEAIDRIRHESQPSLPIADELADL